MKLEKKDFCTGCEACKNVCPNECITMQEDENGFRYPKIKLNECVNCNFCSRICPILNKKNYEFKPEIYAMQSKSDEIRKKSSSGGIFSELALEILNQKGIIYGASFNDNFSVGHIAINDAKDLYKIQGSKYLQSNINNSYKEIKNYLRNEKLVLFSGTGCQIAGLKSYLGVEYENLIAVEVVCHGVPSEKIFRKYIANLESKKQSKVSNVNFRDKVNGWNNYEIKFSFENGEFSSQRGLDNDFMKGYIHNLYLRPSCKDCKFKLMKSGSDILLGDFWGINELEFPWNDDKGSSVVFVNTEKGKQLIDNISNRILKKEVDLDFATRFNPCIVKPVEYSKDAYEDFENMSFHEVIEKNVIVNVQKVTLMTRFKNKVKRILRGKK